MPESIEQQLAQLRAGYLSKLKVHQQALAQYYQALTDPAVQQEQDSALVNLQQLVHQLSGSGGCFGFPDISISAEPLDSYLLALINNREKCQQEDGAKLIAPLFAAIQQALEK